MARPAPRRAPRCKRSSRSPWFSAAASAADHVGYVIGRRYGTRLRDTRPVRRLGTEHWDRAGRMLRRRGPTALVISRLLPLVRTLMPAAAGPARMRWVVLAALVLVAAGVTLWRRARRRSHLQMSKVDDGAQPCDEARELTFAGGPRPGP